jgi:hypothetical protein
MRSYGLLDYLTAVVVRVVYPFGARDFGSYGFHTKYKERLIILANARTKVA